VVELFSSDGNVVSNNFVALNRQQAPGGRDQIIPVIPELVRHPGVAKVLNALSAKLTTVQISKLNLLVTAEKENPATVADRWLQQQGLI